MENKDKLIFNIECEGLDVIQNKLIEIEKTLDRIIEKEKAIQGI